MRTIQKRYIVGSDEDVHGLYLEARLLKEGTPTYRYSSVSDRGRSIFVVSPGAQVPHADATVFSTGNQKSRGSVKAHSAARDASAVSLGNLPA